MPPAGSAKNAVEARKNNEMVALQRDQVKEVTAFFSREYAWTADSRPAAITANTSWSKTIYWRPLVVVPVNGQLELPIDLPSANDIYQFEVFGHDGQGRLGASTIEVKATGKPVSLKTRLSTGEARVGDTIQLVCQVMNLTSRRQPGIIARIPLLRRTN